MASTEVTPEQDALIDQLLQGYAGDPKAILGRDGLLRKLQRRFVERALDGELEAHLKEVRDGAAGGDTRSGHGRKMVQTATDQFEIAVPRDRDASFEPQLVPKRQRRLAGLDDKVIALYARGLSTREIGAQLEELYGVEVSPALVSSVTDAVLDDVRAWQSRPLDPLYPILFFDALVVKSRTDGRVQNKRSTWPWPSTGPARRTCWACGSGRPKAPSSGWVCSPSSRTAGCRIASWPASTA